VNFQSSQAKAKKIPQNLIKSWDVTAVGIMGEGRPLAPFLHGFMGALLHGDGIHGGGENVALMAANSWVEVSLTS
jgi:hypothetical protein